MDFLPTQDRGKGASLRSANQIQGRPVPVEGLFKVELDATEGDNEATACDLLLLEPQKMGAQISVGDLIRWRGTLEQEAVDDLEIGALGARSETTELQILNEPLLEGKWCYPIMNLLSGKPRVDRKGSS